MSVMRKIMKDAYTDFCVKCGKVAEIDKYCAECFAQSTVLFDIRDFRVEFCKCGKINDKEWRKEGLQELIRRHIIENGKIENIHFKDRKVGNRIYVHLCASGNVKNIPVSQEKDFKITSKTVMCDICAKQSGNYHEAVVQIRGPKAAIILDKITRMTKSEEITKAIPLKNGYDVRFIDKGDANEVVGVLQEKYEVKRSYKLVTEKKGKKLYRNFYSIR